MGEKDRFPGTMLRVLLLCLEDWGEAELIAEGFG